MKYIKKFEAQETKDDIGRLFVSVQDTFAELIDEKHVTISQEDSIVVEYSSSGQLETENEDQWSSDDGFKEYAIGIVKFADLISDIDVAIDRLKDEYPNLKINFWKNLFKIEFFFNPDEQGKFLKSVQQKRIASMQSIASMRGKGLNPS